MILGFAGFSILLAITHNAIRKYIYKDAHSLDTVFDAGGKVTLSLTAVTVTSQLLWPADFLQITTITINVKKNVFPNEFTSISSDNYIGCIMKVFCFLFRVAWEDAYSLSWESYSIFSCFQYCLWN